VKQRKFIPDGRWRVEAASGCLQMPHKRVADHQIRVQHREFGTNGRNEMFRRGSSEVFVRLEMGLW
jgi:hypothetical protein